MRFGAGCSTTTLPPRSWSGVSFGCQVAVESRGRVTPRPSTASRSSAPPSTQRHAARGSLALRWARNAPHSSPRLAPTIVHDFIDAGPGEACGPSGARSRIGSSDKLSEIEAPTLIVRPERDRLVPEAWTDRVAEQIPDAELVVLPKAGHSVGPKTATRLTALLVPFLAGDRGRGGIGGRDRGAGAQVGSAPHGDRAAQGADPDRPDLSHDHDRLPRDLDPGRAEGLLRQLPGRLSSLGLRAAALQRAPGA